MNRQKSLNRIAELLGRFTNEVSILNSAGLYDINIHSENILIPLINLAFGLNVVNANFSEERNYSAVDLIDKKNRISFQVTSTADNEKIKHTLSQFIKFERNLDYDLLFIYILGNKQATYTGKGHDEILKGKLVFDKDNHIIDNNDLFKKISSLVSLEQISAIESLLEQEFTDRKIEYRQKALEDPTSVLHTEAIYFNLLPVQVPESLYLADIMIDREAIIKESWETTYRLKMTASTRKVLRRAIESAGFDFYYDWHSVGNQLITFKDLSNPDEPLSNFIDKGTITRLRPKEYWTIDEDHHRSFIALLNFSLTQKLRGKAIHFISEDEVFRFQPDGAIVKERSIEWKMKKRAKRKVIFELMDKDKQQIVCFRHLAFFTQFQLFNESWFLAINPTWSFTNDGHKKSGLTQYYMPGLKRLENNNTIYYAFSFISFCLNNQILQESPYPFLTFGSTLSDEVLTDITNIEEEVLLSDDIPLE